MSAYSEALMLALQAACDAISPKLPLTVSEWADQNRILSGIGSAEKGRWKTRRTPYLREIMDCLSEDSPHKVVAFMKASQVGGTEVGSNWLGYIMCHAKGPVAVTMPTEKSLNDWMSQKFEPMTKETPAVTAALIGRSNRESVNNAQRKHFLGGILFAKTAGSTAELKSTSLRYAMADEVDEYALETTQGDPVQLLQVRQTNFYDSKIFIVSSPTIKDASRIEIAFEAGDQRRYMLACPHCGERQHLKWVQMQFPHVGKRATRAFYVCEHNGCIIEEHEKPAMLASGIWVAQNPDGAYPSFHISGLYSPIGLGLSWLELANEFLAAHDDPTKLPAFINTRLGECWADKRHDIKPHILKARAEPYRLGEVPPGCLLLTAGVDTQGDRLEVQIVGWGRNSTCWVIDYHVIPGNPSDARTWDALAVYLNRTFRNAYGRELRLEATAIDTGGHHTHDVYQFVRSNRARRCIAIKGANTPGKAILGKPTKQDVNWQGKTTRQGVSLYLVGTDTAKALLYARLNADFEREPDEHMIRFSAELGTDAAHPTYFEQLTAETFDARKNRWVIKKGRRNEAMDTWVYALAASQHPEVWIHKKKHSDWDRLALLLEPEAPVPAPPLMPERAQQPAAPARKPRSTTQPKTGFGRTW